MDEWGRIVTDPRLTLHDVEKHLAGENPGELLLGEYRACATGGTTGERAVIVYDRSAWTMIVANVLRWIRVTGATPETRVVGIGAPTPLHVTNRAFAELRTGRADAPHLSVTSPLPEVVESLNRYLPELFLTYPSFVRRLVEEQEAGRLRIRPTTICTSAETLSREVREMVHSTWDGRVLDTYGLTEGGLVGTECDAVAGIHMAEDLLLVEVADEANRAVPPGTPGAKVLLTNLFNRALPLIRYEISDILTIADGVCECGRPDARIASIEGRREDYLQLRSQHGGTVRVHAGRLKAPLSGVPGLRQFQLIPEGNGLRLRITVRDGREPTEVMARAARAVEDSLEGAGAEIEAVAVEVVDRIEPVGTGAKEKLVAAVV